MKATVQEVIDAYGALVKLSVETKGKIPAKGAYWLGRIAKKIEGEWKAANDQRVALITELGDKQEDGSVSVPESKIAEFVAKWKPISEETIELDAPKMKLEHFGDCAADMGDMIALAPFIEE